jgi:beta-lactamase class A
MKKKSATSLKKIIILDIIFLVFLSGIIFGGTFYYFKRHSTVSANNDPSEDNGCASSINLLRIKENGLTRPLLLSDVLEEAASFSPLKDQLDTKLLEWEQAGKIQTASVYLRDLNNGRWMSINGEQAFKPGSLMKVPIMIYYLKVEQEHPGALNKVVVYKKPAVEVPIQTYAGDSIRVGKNYRIVDLLAYMIEQSDNNATILLSTYLDHEIFDKIFTDLDIIPDEKDDFNYTITAKQYGKFFRILFNSSYLDEPLSEFGLELLANCKFDKGIIKGVPDGTKVPRKFGEQKVDNYMEFCESGIIYKNDNPYLLVIMTRGNNTEELTNFVAELSGIIYNGFDQIAQKQ